MVYIYNYKGQWEEARSHGQVAFGLNVAGTVLGILAWIIIIICSIFVFSVVGSAEKAFSDISSGVTLSSGDISGNFDDNWSSSWDN